MVREQNEDRLDVHHDPVGKKNHKRNQTNISVVSSRQR